ncbi:MAG: EamA family transporter [Desmonostoc vinosum HA7617-LM4]|jgi:drug/metabolite transporter (DMT)-like permease|nr:EamA family transporter [Desmonostoc vinosum HA7617-LM4]
MGRFEKQPDNPRIRGDLSRAAENALWAVVDDLENLQQNVLKALQEDIKRLQSEKNRLTSDIQHLQEEKEQLLKVRQITEQQVLIRQLAEVLAKHISSQLQSSLSTLATQVNEGNSYERTTLKSAEVSSNIVGEIGEINQKVEHMLGNLDDTVTITFNSLQQELKNYQSNLSQQLSRMYNQQQQGETILMEFMQRLNEELEKTREETSPKAPMGGIPTVIQLPEQEEKNYFEISPEFGKDIRNNTESNSTIPKESSTSETEFPFAPITLNLREPLNSETTSSAALPLPKKNVIEPISVLSKDLSESEVVSPVIQSPLPKENTTEPISVLSKDLSESEVVSPVIQSPLPKENIKDLSENEATSSVVPPEPPKKNVVEPISVLGRNLSQNETTSPVVTPEPPKKKAVEPISVLSRNLPKREVISLPPTAPAPKQRAKSSATSRSRNSSNLAPIQIGFLLIVLSTVISALYNVAIKVIFYEGSLLGVIPVQRLLLPTLGNVLLMLTLRLIVVVPIMVLLAPILHPRVWQDLQKLGDSVRGNSTRSGAASQQILWLSIVSGFLLFVSQVLIYLAISQVATGVAIALFFIYPVIVGLLSLLLFRDRFSLFGGVAIAAICCGEIFVLASSPTDISNISLGSTAAMISGVAFACYIILTRLCANKIHPVSFTLINFATMLAVSFVCLMLPLPGEWNLLVSPSKFLELVLSAFILGVLTLSSHIFNNFGVRKLGASKSAMIVDGSIPVLTVIFAGLIIQENLDIPQIIGVLLVTFGAFAFSFEKIRNQVKSFNSTN